MFVSARAEPTRLAEWRNVGEGPVDELGLIRDGYTEQGGDRDDRELQGELTDELNASILDEFIDLLTKRS